MVDERLDLAARVAHDVVMVLAARVSGLVARGAGAEVDLLDEALVDEQVERAVDARDPDAAVVRAELVEDLLRGEAAVLPGEELDDGLAGAAAAVALAAERRERRVPPVGRADGCH